MPSGHGSLDIRGAVLIDLPVVAKVENVRVTRSFSYKLNLGNYQSADFFCSQSAECAPDDTEEVSSDLDDFCTEQVRASIRNFQHNQAAKSAGKQAA